MYSTSKTRLKSGGHCNCGACHVCTRISAVIDNGSYDITCSDSVTTRSNSNDQIAFIHDQWLHHKDDLSHKFHTDLLLLLGNKEEFHLHSAIVAPHSAMLTQLLGDSQGDVQTSTLYMPEVDKATVLLMIDLLYTGQSFCSFENISELNNLLNSLGLKQLLQSLEFSEAEIQHGRADSNFCKVEPAEYTEQDFEKDEIIFLKEIFGGARDQLFSRDDRHARSTKLKKNHERRGPSLNADRNMVVKKIERSKNAVKREDSRKSKATFDCNNCRSKFSSDKQLKVHKKVQCGNSDFIQSLSKTKVHKKTKIDLNKITELKSLIGIEKVQNKYDKFTRGSKSMLAAGSNTIKVKAEKIFRQINLPAHTGVLKKQKGSPRLLSSRQVVHGRNNITWAGEALESYEDIDVSWVKKKMEGELRQFEDVTDGEKSFFCSWNKFLTDHKPGVAKIHLKTVLEEFVDQWGKEVMKYQLYVEFVTHLVWLEQSGLISQQCLLTTVQRIQGLGN